MKKIIKIGYLILGILLFIGINYLSYFVEPYSTNKTITYKLIFTFISLILMLLIYVLILKPKILIKHDLKKETIIALYIGVIIIPLISLSI